MKKIRVNLGLRSYNILIGANILALLSRQLERLRLGKVAMVVTNQKINRLYGHLLLKVLKHSGVEVCFAQVPDSEASKSAAECLKLIEKCSHADRGKGLFLIAFGGGVIGDLTGFVASVYRRGIPYIQIPTTLLAQVDSSIGGKVAIDLACGKNLIGSFYQPRLVLSEFSFLSSLSLAHIQQALAEIIKYGIIADRRFFQFLEDNIAQILELNPEKLRYIIEVSSQIKSRIVKQDETDKKGIRMILNFGHTTAHALEAAAGYRATYAHGYAVALGMLVAAEIGLLMKLTSARTVKRIEDLIRKVGLPTKISGLRLKDILEAQSYDKKFNLGKNRFVLPLGIGKVVVKEGIPQEIIKKAIKAKMS